MVSFAEAAAEVDEVAAQARRVAPVVWLLGKVQAGKSSIVRALTGATHAEIGSGYRACTKSADIYEVPDEAPVIRFLDTRGLGEAAYDPGEDLKVAAATSHCTIAVVRAMDHQQDAVIDALREVRRQKPDWPIVVAQTHLHEGYDLGAGHVEPYPFADEFADTGDSARDAGVPRDLLRSLEYQRRQFEALPGKGKIAFVPIDFTAADDGFEPQFYGIEALQAALVAVGPAALSAALKSARSDEDDAERRQVHRLILGHAAAASAVDLVPVAAVAAVPAVQATMLHSLGRRHGVNWSRRTALEFSGVLGAGLLARYAAGFGIRQLAKMVPVYGQTAGAAAAALTSFATTYALGKAAEFYLARQQDDGVDDEAVRRVWTEALGEAVDLARARGLGRGDKADGA